MGKSDDSIRRRKNRKTRNKQENKYSSSKVSARVASIIAAKKRRMSGKRSNCQGMCFSLPTPEDPFNDRDVTIDLGKKRKKPVRSKADRMPIDKNSVKIRKRSLDNNDAHVDHQKQELMIQDNAVKFGKEMVKMSNGDRPKHVENKHGFENNIECPSKFLIMCLNSIQNALCHSGTFNCEDEPFFAYAWGVEFWNFYSNGKNVLETSGADSTIQQIAWMASTAADTIARKEKEGLLFTGPFLLFLVPSQEKASQVRQVCKPLKALGIHTVSLHSGASIDHQINGLKSCEPEFLVSTPQRLLELVSLKAVDISGVSLLVIDGLEVTCEGDTIKSIRHYISGDAKTVVFSDCMNNSSVSVVQNLLPGSVCR
ncbi:P-loop containing nucleoside triphosphate hydrolase superfamily protein [Abeliophyllum distichum]|uniref:P-loop containing nucleoside triphosphate hydrolase superfamily protein n=1 Tax=Abeliophyllum distichum TaxID=126358 RepID=A0ABD1ULL9_9LAMI